MEKAKFAFLGGQNAGKTSILRRYFQGTFYGDCRMPTIGADVYSTIVSANRPDPPAEDTAATHGGGGEAEETRGRAGGKSPDESDGGDDDDDAANHNHAGSDQRDRRGATRRPEPQGRRRRQPISIQVWDTPGRERFENTGGTTRYKASFSDDFLKDLDAVCLVYDVSSSTSFTHVLNWYYELIERLRRMKANHGRCKRLHAGPNPPIVIVGNKIDIIEHREQKNTRRRLLLRRQKDQLAQNRKRESVVQQRDVLGLAGKNWRGRDYRYEYASSSSSASSKPSGGTATTSNTNANSANANANANNTGNNEEGNENRLELLTYLGTNTNYLEAILNNEVYRGSYLDSLLSSEDNSHPDKDMVQLWCTRNGLIHMDVSAKSGAGIHDLVQQLIEIALKQIDESGEHPAGPNSGTGANANANTNTSTAIAASETTAHGGTGDRGFRESSIPLLLQHNKELDLHQRYGPKSKTCFWPFPLSFRWCYGR